MSDVRWRALAESLAAATGTQANDTAGGSSCASLTLTRNANGTTTRTTELKDIQINASLSDKDFLLPPVDEKKWTSAETALSMSGVRVRFLCRQKENKTLA